jgi:SAM-dependent methyltransferase
MPHELKGHEPIGGACWRPCVLAAVLFLVAGAAVGPLLAQPRFDVPFVPTPMVVVDEMLKLANVGPDDFVMDLGSGDGRVVIAAAKKFGARGIGVELDQHLVIQSDERARQAGVEARVKFFEQDIFKTDLSPATVITMYLFPDVNRRLRERLLTLKPGTRIVSHDYDLGDWRPDRTSTIRKKVFLWIVPAQVAGRWQIRLALPPIERLIEVEFTQRYQEVSGSARLNGVPAPIWGAELTGARLSFTVVDTTDRDNEASLYFEGRMADDAIEGQVTRGVGKAQATAQWRAIRVRR